MSILIVLVITSMAISLRMAIKEDQEALKKIAAQTEEGTNFA